MAMRVWRMSLVLLAVTALMSVAVLIGGCGEGGPPATQQAPEQGKGTVTTSAPSADPSAVGPPAAEATAAVTGVSLTETVSGGVTQQSTGQLQIAEVAPGTFVDPNVSAATLSTGTSNVHAMVTTTGFITVEKSGTLSQGGAAVAAINLPTSNNLLFLLDQNLILGRAARFSVNARRIILYLEAADGRTTIPSSFSFNVSQGATSLGSTVTFNWEETKCIVPPSAKLIVIDDYGQAEQTRSVSTDASGNGTCTFTDYSRQFAKSAIITLDTRS